MILAKQKGRGVVEPALKYDSTYAFVESYRRIRVTASLRYACDVLTGGTKPIRTGGRSHPEE